MLPAAEIVIETSSSEWPPAKRVKTKVTSLPNPFPLPSNTIITYVNTNFATNQEV